MTMSFDETDHAIIHALQGDGRAPFAQLGRDLGISEATVRSRVSRMLRSDVVKVVASVDALALGYTVAYVGVRLRGGTLDRALRALDGLAEVTYVVATAGSYDLLAETVCTDGEGLMRLLDEGIRQVPGVEHAEAFTVLRIAKDDYQWPGGHLAGPASQRKAG